MNLTNADRVQVRREEDPPGRSVKNKRCLLSDGTFRWSFLPHPVPKRHGLTKARSSARRSGRRGSSPLRRARQSPARSLAAPRFFVFRATCSRYELEIGQGETQPAGTSGPESVNFVSGTSGSSVFGASQKSPRSLVHPNPPNPLNPLNP